MKLKYRKITTEVGITIKSTMVLTREEIVGIRRIMDHEHLDPENYRPEGQDDFEKMVSLSHWVKEMAYFSMLWENRDKDSVQSIIMKCIDRKLSKKPRNPRKKK